jgi:hypothetical protein
MRRKHANALAASKSFSVDASQREQLEDFAERLADAKEIGFYEFARRANALQAYDLLYRHLSNSALHSNLSAVDDYLVRDAAGALRVRYQPVEGKAVLAVLTVCAGLLFSASACERGGVMTPVLATSLAALWRDFHLLSSKLDPWGEHKSAE